MAAGTPSLAGLVAVGTTLSGSHGDVVRARSGAFDLGASEAAATGTSAPRRTNVVQLSSRSQPLHTLESVDAGIKSRGTP